MKIISNIWFHVYQRQAYYKQHLNMYSLYSEALYEIQPLLCSLTPVPCSGVPFPNWYKGTGWTSSGPVCSSDEFALICSPLTLHIS